MRLSSAQLSKLNAELSEYRNKMESNNHESELLKQRIQKLLSENSSLSEEVRTGQENLRLSTAQASKLGNELNEFRKRLGATTQES